MVGPFVTNPATRDPTVTASVFATLNDMFGNRTVCAIGRGDSARRVLGKKPTTLAQTERAIHVIKELAEGRAIETPGRRRCASPGCATGGSRCGWPPTARRRSRSSGARPTASCSRSPTPRSSAGRSTHVREAAEAAGRDPGEITVLVARPGVRGRRPRRTSATSAAGSAGWSATTSPRSSSATATHSDIPAALTDYIKARKSYDYAHHGRADNPDTPFVPDEIVDRFCVLGTADGARRQAAGARGAGHGPVRRLPHARRHGGDARGLRRRRDPGVRAGIGSAAA